MPEKLGLSYHNVRALHSKVDTLPLRSGEWLEAELTFRDRPDETFTLRHRHIVEAIQSLWGNPGLLDELVFRPMKMFTDNTESCSMYNELWTSQWWWTLQVSQFT